MNILNKKIIIITGPTASGKTSLAIKLAANFSGEIISADSRQVYKGLDIGTGKDLKEYFINGKNIKHWLIDICLPEEEYNLKEFNCASKGIIDDIIKREKLPFIVGGTTLYVDSIISNYKFPLPPPDCKLRDNIRNFSSQQLRELLSTKYPHEEILPENINSKPRLVRVLESKIFETNKEEVGNFPDDIYKFLILAPYYERKFIHERIKKRLFERFDEGMIEEVENLHKSGISWERLDSFGLEYRYISQYVQKKITKKEMEDTLLAKIRKLARSQDVWFRKMERNGQIIHWVKNGNYEDAESLIKLFLNNMPLPEPDIQLKNLDYGIKN